MPRILLLITDLELGGTPIVVRELATRLRSPELEIEVACLKPMGIVGQQLQDRGVRVTAFNAKGVLDLPRVVRELAKLVNERQIDTVFSFLLHANFIAARAARSWHNVTILQSIQTTQPRPRWHWWIQKRIWPAADRIVVPSESIAKRAMEWCDVPRERIDVIPNAVDVDRFRGMSVTPIPSKDERDAHATFRIGFVGRLDPIKRIPDLLAAIASMPARFQLDIYGEGAMRPQIEHAISTTAGLPGRVTLRGSLLDVRQAYAAMDVLVLPSDAEGFGVVLIEAMAAGVPVIGTNVDGIRDVIRDGETGLLVPPRNPAAIAAAIERIADDRLLHDRLIANALTDVQQRFAWPAVLERYRALLSPSHS